jgi:hypothetical protein
MPKVTNVEFNDREFIYSLSTGIDPAVFDYMLCLALCHSVII